MGRDKIQCGTLTIALRLGLELGNITFSDTSILSGEDSGTRFADQAGQPLPLASLLIASERASGRRSRPLKGMRPSQPGNKEEMVQAETAAGCSFFVQCIKSPLRARHCSCLD